MRSRSVKPSAQKMQNTPLKGGAWSRLVKERKNRLPAPSAKRLAATAAVVRSLLLAAPVSLMVLLFFTISAGSTMLRPIADDYCHGAIALNGAGSALTFWFFGWSTDLVGLLAGVGLVGLPLANFPFWAASSVAFISSGIAVGALGLSALLPTLRANFTRNFVASLTISVGWWLHLRVGQVLEFPAGADPGDSKVVSLAEILTHWQTINGGVVTVSLTLILLLWSYFYASRSKRGGAWILAFAAFLFGAGSLVLALSAVAVGSLLTVCMLLLRRRDEARRLGLVSISTLTGVVVSLSAPGAAVRFDTNVSLDSGSLLLAFRSMPFGVTDWLDSMVSFPTLFAFGIGALLAGTVLRTADSTREAMNLGSISFVFILTSLVFFVAVQASEILVYNGLWHFVPAQILIFVGSVTLGVHAATWVSQWLARNKRFEAPGLVAAAVLIIGISWLAVISTGALMSSAQERLLAWESGPAEIRNLNYMQDRGTDWVNACWVELENGRELAD